MKTIVVFSGAGLSAESGVPTFRDSNGLWENHKVEDVASPEGWARDMDTVLRFYEARFKGVKSCQPNAAHKAFANLESKYKVLHITQNIDDLLERAGCSHVTHLHGSLVQRKCSKHKSCSVLDGDTNYTCTYKALQHEPVLKGELCPLCNSQLRPNVVWFGEAVSMPKNDCKDLVDEVVNTDGVFITVGTSAQVYPAAFLMQYFKPARRKYYIDKSADMRRHVYGYIDLEGEAGKLVPRLVDELLKE